MGILVFRPPLKLPISISYTHSSYDIDPASLGTPGSCRCSDLGNPMLLLMLTHSEKTPNQRPAVRISHHESATRNQRPDVGKVLRLPRNLHVEVLQVLVLRLPGTRAPSNINSGSHKLLAKGLRGLFCSLKAFELAWQRLYRNLEVNKRMHQRLQDWGQLWDQSWAPGQHPQAFTRSCSRS